MKQNFLIVLLLTIPGIVAAQSYREDVMKSEKTFTEKPISLVVKYDLFDAHGNKAKLVQHMQAAVYMHDLLYAYKTDELELLTNHKVTMSVDHFQQVVLINKHYPGEKRTMMKEMQQLFDDTIRSSIVTDSLLLSNAELKVWRIQYKLQSSDFAYIDVSFSALDNKLLKIIYYYNRTFGEIYEDAPEGTSINDKPRLEVTFSNYKLMTIAEQQTIFSGEDVVKMDNKGNAALLPKYKNYTLSNYYNAKP